MIDKVVEIVFDDHDDQCLRMMLDIQMKNFFFGEPCSFSGAKVSLASVSDLAKHSQFQLLIVHELCILYFVFCILYLYFVFCILYFQYFVFADLLVTAETLITVTGSSVTFNMWI